MTHAADLPLVSPPRPRLLIPYAVLAVSLLITFAAAAYVAITSNAKDRARFENAVDRTQLAIKNRIETYENLLMSGTALFNAARSVNHTQFKTFVERLDLPNRYPGIQGIGVSYRIPPGQMDAIVKRMKDEGVKDFHIFPLDPPREEYHAILYLQPENPRNARAVGFDMSSDATRRAAMELARDTGRPAMSGLVTLIQDQGETNKQAGFLLYVPVYFLGTVPQEAGARQIMLAGYIYAPFRGDDLLRGIMGQERFTSGIEFDVYDGDKVVPQARLHHYESPGARASADVKPQFTKTLPLELPQREWTLVYRSTAGFESNSTRGYTLLVLAAGGIASVLLFALSASQAAATQRAQHALDQSRRSAALLRASENKFRRLADANLVGVAFTRADGGVLEVNDEVCRILARPRDEVTAADFKWHEVTPPEGLDADRHAIAQLQSRGICAPYEKEFIRPDGSRVPVLLGIAQIEGAERDCVALVVDLTTRKQAERDLIAAKETAERALEQAEQASRLKDEFLATVSHELRTPLNAILGWSQLLGHGRESSPADLQQGLATIERAARAQAQLIDDLLDVSRIVAGKLRLDMQIVQPIHVIEAALASIHPAADAKGVRIVNALDAQAGPVSADPNRLQQIVWNLLANAVKFTPKDGVVQIALKRAEGDDATVQIVVSDTGIGIPHEFLPFVFDRFRQADASTTRRYGGLGLGLGIVRHLTESHGGTVTVDSPGPGGGSTFAVSLPRVIATPSTHAPDLTSPKASSKGASLPGVRVLLVEDDADARDLMTRVLHENGASVTAVGSAAEAMEIFPALRPDVIVSDIGMPDEDGYSLIARIRAMPAERGGRVPAVALTALARPEDRRRAILAGYQVHLSKPVEAAELSATLANLLDGKRPA
jgi:PAS domain S-box-containing protein